MKFRTAYDGQRVLGINEPGNRIEPQYTERYDKKGHPYLEHTGDVNTYEQIQSYKDDCDINSILQRYAAGDESIVHPGYYIDTTNLPKSYHEYFNLMKEQKEKFAHLPIDIKQKFNNSFEEWASTSGTEEWVNKMGLTKDTSKNSNEGEIENEPKQ